MIGIYRDKLISCMQLMLTPVARFCVRYSIHIGDISEALKRALVKAAEEQIMDMGKRPTASRIKAMCGLHRREIMRVLHSADIKEGKDSFITKIIGQWQSDKRFCVKSGKGKPLTFKGENSQFETLVRTVNQELKPGTILFELERLEVVKKDKEKDSVTLDIGSYAPRENVTELMTFLAKDTSNLMEAVTDNIFSPPTPANLHATTEYDNIDPKAVPQVRKWLIQQGKEFHRKAREFLSKFDRDIFPTAKEEQEGARVAIGTFGLVKQKRAKAKPKK